MVDINSVYKNQSNKWKAEDLNGQAYDMVIGNIEIIDFNDGAKACVYFQGDERGLVLNVTNKNTLVEMFGPDTDDWVGQTVTMFPTTTTWNNKMVPCIRLMRPIVHANAAPQPVRQMPSPQVQQMPPAKPQDYNEINPPPVTQHPQDFKRDLDDEIPF